MHSFVYLSNQQVKNVITILLFLISTLYVPAQEILITPKPKAKLLTAFHFRQYSGGVMVIRACLNDIPDSLNFILDTGSGGISLDSATCDKYNIHHQLTDTIISGLGGTRKVHFAFNQNLHLPGLVVEKLNFHINDYDVLSSVYGEKIDGIIGYSFFNRYIVKIDFDENLLEVYQPGEISYPRGGTLLRPAFTLLPIETLHIKDARKMEYNFYFDTGAGLCFLMSENLVSDSAILLPKRNPVITQAEGMGGKLQMRLTVIKQLKIGNYVFRKVPTYLYNDNYNVTSYPFIGGLIGNDLLRRFNMVINYPQKEIHLSPNKHFTEPFDYSYTGMAIYDINGNIVIDDVVPGSPADKAGLRKEDIIISVGNNFSKNIQQYKTLLQTTNETLHLVISRNNDLIEIKMRPGTFIH